ncbi:DUF1768 domain-containing protein [Paenactinomyces guangxiensis]|nr:DUF1768 domain-containing protein [Paenactinomyces guangxiensis]
MRRADYVKFQSHDDLQQILLSTGNEGIIEKTTKDMYWGCGSDGTGKNRWGKY